MRNKDVDLKKVLDPVEAGKWFSIRRLRVFFHILHLRKINGQMFEAIVVKFREFQCSSKPGGPG